MGVLIFLTVGLSIFFSFSSITFCEIVHTSYGPIEGDVKTSALGRTYYSFQRIPYMRPPNGTLRFRDPEPPTPWTIVLNCTFPGPKFPQIDRTQFKDEPKFEGDLDSMHINVYSPELPLETENVNRTLMPVLVWIHGGAFTFGSGLTDIYGPDYFMEKNVVLVTFNYRLHVFGFLSLDDPDLQIPGNAGLKDQVMAMQWVKTNIENFGGNPENITLFGQSAGGGSVHYHTMAEASKNLFNSSIIMSGSAFNYIYSVTPRRNWAFRLVEEMGYEGVENETEILTILEQEEPEKIYNAIQYVLTPYEQNQEKILTAFGPCIEPFSTPRAFLLDHPENLARSSWGKDLNILIGATSFENGALVPLIQKYPFLIDDFADFGSYVPRYFHREHSENEIQHHEEILRKSYYGMMEPTSTNIDGTILLTNDFLYWHPIHRTVRQRLSMGNSAEGKTYVYRFNVQSNNHCFSKLNHVPEIYRQPIHMDELCYLFKPEFEEVHERNSIEWDAMERMIDLFVNFATHGSPEYAGWDHSTTDRAELWGCTIYANEFECDEFPEAKRMKIWDDMVSRSTYTKPGLFSISIGIFIMIVKYFLT